jgi:hypothetical protein
VWAGSRFRNLDARKQVRPEKKNGRFVEAAVFH